jgi:hypothetical protein
VVTLLQGLLESFKKGQSKILADFLLWVNEAVI